MSKQVIIDLDTNTTQIIDVPNEPVIEIPNEPTLEERVKATEDAILMLMDLGVM